MVDQSAQREPAERNPDRLLAVVEAALLFGTTERFPRRLIAERRIHFVKVGRHVRIPSSAVDEFISAGTVQPWDERRA